MRRFVLLSLLCACSTLSSEQRKLLASHQQNAAIYLEKANYRQAMGQIDKGLELEPDDYKLNAMRGRILLATSGTASGTDHTRLDQATELLERVYQQRSPSRHEPYLLLDLGLAVQKQGLRHLGEAVRLEGLATRTPGDEAADLRQRAAAERTIASEQLQRAWDLLGNLVERGELLRVVHSHRMQIAAGLGNDEKFAAEAEAFFAQSQLDQKRTRQLVESTSVAAFEAEQLQIMRQLRDEELEVRTLVAKFHHDRKQFQPALEQLNRVLEIDPRRFSNYYDRGRVLLELGRDEDAKADFRRFLADPSLSAGSERATFALKALTK